MIIQRADVPLARSEGLARPWRKEELLVLCPLSCCAFCLAAVRSLSALRPPENPRKKTPPEKIYIFFPVRLPDGRCLKSRGARVGNSADMCFPESRAVAIVATGLWTSLAGQSRVQFAVIERFRAPQNWTRRHEMQDPRRQLRPVFS